MSVPVTLQHPQTGQRATCGTYYEWHPLPSVNKFQREAKAACVKNLKQLGYETVKEPYPP